MLPRISRYVLAVAVAAGLFRADVAHAVNSKFGGLLQLTSLEWLVAEVDVVVRGVVVDVAGIPETWKVCAVIFLAATPCYWLIRPRPLAAATARAAK